MKIFIFILIGFHIGISTASAVERPFPNIILINVDDLGYGDIGPFGNSVIHTPHLDVLAKQGMVLTNFAAPASVCTPSRAGLLTGRYPARYGLNRVLYPESFVGLPQAEITIAEVLKQKGYNTAAIGKWHLGHREKFLPLAQGFDMFFGLPYSNDMSTPALMRGNQVVDMEPDQSLLTGAYTREAVRFIEQTPGPFFLYLAHTMPHVPIYASQDFAGRSQGGVYGDVVEEIDWSVGEIMTALERRGLVQDTFVLFTSDNGPALSMGKYGGSAGNLREGKHSTFEGGIRVPTIAWWPDKIPAGTRYDGLLTGFDVLPTIAAIAGQQLPENTEYDGDDILPILTQSGSIDHEKFYIYFESSTVTGFRIGKWKLKLPHPGQYSRFAELGWPGGYAAHGLLLFDLEQDPGETTDLSEEKPELVSQLRAAMDKAVMQLGPLPPTLEPKGYLDHSAQDYRAEMLHGMENNRARKQEAEQE